MQIEIIHPKQVNGTLIAVINLTKYGPKARWNLCRHTRRRPGKYICMDSCQKMKLDEELNRLGVKRLSSYHYMMHGTVLQESFYMFPITVN